MVEQTNKIAESICSYFGSFQKLPLLDMLSEAHNYFYYNHEHGGQSNIYHFNFLEQYYPNEISVDFKLLKEYYCLRTYIDLIRNT